MTIWEIDALVSIIILFFIMSLVFTVTSFAERAYIEHYKKFKELEQQWLSSEIKIKQTHNGCVPTEIPRLTRCW